MSLKPQTLDIIIRKIADTYVEYDLTLTGERKRWDTPSNSTFDKSTIRENYRYRIDSNVILTKVRITKKAGKRFYKTMKYETIERYDWVTATPLASYIPCQARSAKQTRQAHEAGRLELVDDGQLFDWNPK